MKIDDFYESRRKKAAERQAYLEKKRLMRARRREFFILTGFTLFLCAALILHITLEQDIRTRTKRLDSLETEVLNLRQENNDTEKRLTSSVDLEFVRRQADKLGMVEAGSRNIAYYTVPKVDFMYSHE